MKSLKSYSHKRSSYKPKLNALIVFFFFFRFLFLLRTFGKLGYWHAKGFYFLRCNNLLLVHRQGFFFFVGHACLGCDVSSIICVIECLRETGQDCKHKGVAIER